MTYKISLYTKPSALCEIYQQVGMSFAICGTKQTEDVLEVTQLHPFVLCRDFLGDALYANNKKTSFGIYGFSFNGKETPFDTKMTYMLVRLPDNNDESYKKFYNGLRVLNYYETIGKWRKTKIVETDLVSEKKRVILLVSTGKWISGTQLVSLFTLLVRCMWKGINEGEQVPDFLKRISTVQDNDGNYLRAMLKVYDLFKTDPLALYVKHNRTMFANTYNFSGGTHEYHDNNGITSLSKYICYKKTGEQCFYLKHPTFLKDTYEEFVKHTDAV